MKPAPPRDAVGFDGGQKITGRTRHLLVDTLGGILAVVGTSADTDERLGLVAWLTQYFAEGVTRLRTVWVDGAAPAAWLEEWGRGVKQTPTIDREATTQTEGTGCHVRPWRWAVARTCAWLLKDRRHRRDDARSTAKSAAMIQMSMIRLLLNRLA
jgi:hypothetical protein